MPSPGLQQYALVGSLPSYHLVVIHLLLFLEANKIILIQIVIIAQFHNTDVATQSYVAMHVVLFSGLAVS